MKTTRTITADMLSEHKACAEQYELFCRTWPDGCKVTLEDCKNAVRLGFNIDWAAQHLLGKAELDAYHEAFATAWKAFYEAVAPARKAFDEAVAPARKAYNEAVAPVQKAYNEAAALAWKAYDEAVAPARKAHDEVVAPVQKVFNEAKVIAFHNAWNLM